LGLIFFHFQRTILEQLDFRRDRMGLLRKAAKIYAHEGAGPLLKEGLSRLIGRSRHVRAREKEEAEREAADARMESARLDYERQVAAFRDQLSQRGITGLDDYYWYHTVDLGGDLITPGDYDFRDRISSFGFPMDLKGSRVLDVGSATGYFAFEFERRGAEVLSVDLPSLSDWDIISSERDRLMKDLMAWLKAKTPEEAYERHIDGPFLFCRKMLGSKVSRCYSNIYDLTLDKVGGTKFDLIYAGDILLHLFSPLAALDVLAGLCADRMIVTLDIPLQPLEKVVMQFSGMDSKETDCRSWWLLSPACLESMLKRVGFKSISVIGEYSGTIRRAWDTYRRQLILASRT
jgi:SAM-dependent methyltransferase